MSNKKNAAESTRANDGKSLAAVMKNMPNNTLRDPYTLLDWGDSKGGHFQAGYSVIYPGCRSGGHEHSDLEEVYHVVSGQGIMHIGEEEFNVGPGDTWVVPINHQHWTDNPGNLPLEMFWIVIKI
jgi:mannose-6-phosphate isomerase-like protein (cupin superfamily)